jgi:hypothetical protein
VRQTVRGAAIEAPLHWRLGRLTNAERRAAVNKFRPNCSQKAGISRHYAQRSGAQPSMTRKLLACCQLSTTLFSPGYNLATYEQRHGIARIPHAARSLDTQHVDNSKCRPVEDLWNEDEARAVVAKRLVHTDVCRIMAVFQCCGYFFTNSLKRLTRCSGVIWSE